MADLIGRTLGRYHIVEKIGEGGMAAVYKAYQPGLDRYVAVKVLPPLHAKQPGFSERFQREAKAIANLHHQNILPVHDSGQEDGYSFIVMRYVEGARTLKEVMQTPLKLSQAADLIGQIAAALDCAHRQGVVHRDVKPANVLMDGDWALLSDFGLAKITEASVALTGTGVGVGTPAYMSPEQGQGMPVDSRTDIYSLGIILFEMLTGRIPHNAETPVAIIFKRATEPLPLPRALNPSIPESVERVILKALAREPEDRYARAGELAAALKEAVSGVDTLEAPAPVFEEQATAVAPQETESKKTPPVVTLHIPWRPPGWAWGLAGLGLLLMVGIAYLAGRPAPGLLSSDLAFISDQAGRSELYVMDGKDKVARLTYDTANDSDPAWSPDKTRLAFASDRSGNWEIYWINADGTGLTQLTNNPAREVEPAWSPDGRYIAFTSDRDGKREIYVAGPDEIGRITYTPGDAESWHPAWAPDSTLLFTSTRDGKREVHRTTNSGEVVRLTYSPGGTESWSPVWCWAGNYTAFVSDREGRQEIYTLLAGGVLQRITHSSGGWGSWEPACSLLGQSIAFTSDRDGRREIYTVTQEGANNLTRTPNPGGSWSPAW